MKCTFNLCECLITLVWYIVSQIEILLGKTENFDELMAAAAEEREAGDVEEQQSWEDVVSLASSLWFLSVLVLVKQGTQSISTFVDRLRYSVWD